MGVTAVIIQSNYIPWKGYFDLLSTADVVVMFDSVQSTKNDWRNRNRIKSPSGLQWLSVPVRHSNSLRIREVEVANANWARKHLASIRQLYGKAPFAQEAMPLLEEWYGRANEQARLSEVNRIFIRGICHALGIAPRFVEAEDIFTDTEHDALDPTSRLVVACRRVGASRYVSGPAARQYLAPQRFEDAGIGLGWFDYNDYPEYPQLYGAFEHAVSILDLLLMVGIAQAPLYALRQRTTN